MLNSSKFAPPNATGHWFNSHLTQRSQWCRHPVHDTSFAGLSRIFLGAKAVTPVGTSVACKVWPVANLKNVRWWILVGGFDCKQIGEKCWHVHKAKKTYCILIMLLHAAARRILTCWQAQNTWLQKKSIRILARLPLWVYASIRIFTRCICSLSAANIALCHPWDLCTLSSVECTGIQDTIFGKKNCTSSKI